MVTEETRKTRSADLFDVSEHELETALEGYLEEEETPSSKPGLLNVVTVTGFAFLMVGFLAVVQYFLPLGLEVGSLLNVLPLIGGIIVMLVGLGFFTRQRRKKQKKNTFRDAVRDAEPARKGINNDLNKDETKTASSSFSSGTGSYSSGQTEFSSASDLDSFGLKQKKKLFRSRKDKMLFGVCGGLANYLGMDPTLVRIITAALFFFGYGTVLPVYIVLGLILPKEPREL